MNGGPGGFEDLHVLIVDDEKSVVKVLHMMLTRIGVAKIFTAKDGIEALDFLGAGDDRVNTVICDLNMPRMSGIQLLERVRARDPHMAFVMVTGNATMEAVYGAKILDVTAFVAKPFSQNEIRRKLGLVVSRMAERAPQ